VEIKLKFLFTVLNADGTDVKLNTESERYEIGVDAKTVDSAMAKVHEFIEHHPELNDGPYMLVLTDGNHLQKFLLNDLDE
jgi:uncharacterized protein YlxP (DUF503 family)